jgi:hypothetical protein
MHIFFIIGVCCIVISGILIGVWSDGQRQRDYYQAEDSERRNVRMKGSMLFALVGLLSFAIAGFMYYLQ